MAYGGTETSQSLAEQNKADTLSETQEKVDEVVDIMKENTEKVLQRGENVAILEERAKGVLDQASQFDKISTALKRKFWWQNYKMWIMLVCAVLAIAGVIAISIVISQ